MCVGGAEESRSLLVSIDKRTKSEELLVMYNPSCTLLSLIYILYIVSLSMENIFPHDKLET